MARQKADLDFCAKHLPSLLAESGRAGTGHQIVQDLKDFSRVDQAEYQLANRNAAWESIAECGLERAETQGGSGPRTGRHSGSRGAWHKSTKVFMNLLVNAAQAIDTRGIASPTRRGERPYLVRGGRYRQRHSPDICKRIFEPFFTTKPVGKGTARPVDFLMTSSSKHGGLFDVTSAPRRPWTTFRLWLPIQPGKDKLTFVHLLPVRPSAAKARQSGIHPGDRSSQTNFPRNEKNFAAGNLVRNVLTVVFSGFFQP